MSEYQRAKDIEQTGPPTSFNGANGVSDIEGKTAWAAASERGEGASFNAIKKLQKGCSLQL